MLSCDYCKQEFDTHLDLHNHTCRNDDKETIITKHTGINHPEASSGAQREKLHSNPYDLFPFIEVVEPYCRVAEFGAKKYAPWNWTKGLARVQIICSMLRHIFCYLRGEDYDKDSGLLHTDHILWNACALSHNVYHNLEDGRRKEPKRDYKS